jgi:hypothetical protein
MSHLNVLLCWSKKHKKFFFGREVFLETGSCYVVQSGLKLKGSSDLPVLASRIEHSMDYKHVQPCLTYLFLLSEL